MGTFRELISYKKGFELLMEVFELSKAFPKEELYSLTSQIRRSSRSVCSSIGVVLGKLIKSENIQIIS